MFFFSLTVDEDADIDKNDYFEGEIGHINQVSTILIFFVSHNVRFCALRSVLTYTTLVTTHLITEGRAVLKLPTGNIHPHFDQT